MVRQVVTYCGLGYKPRYKEIDIFAYTEPVRGKRSKKRKRSSPVQKKLNDTNSKRYFNQEIKANFTEEDQRVDLTYNVMPESEEAADKIVANFLKKIKRLRKKRELSPLKYIWVNERGRNNRIHHHLLINGGLSREEVEALWCYRKKKGQSEPTPIGYVRCEPLRFSPSGIDGLVNYITKETFKREDEPCGQMTFSDLSEGAELSLADLLVDDAKGKKRWKQSKNLIKPHKSTKDNALSRRQVLKLVSMPSDCEYVRNFFTQRFPGYAIDTVTYRFNEVLASWSIYLTMHRLN
ncbi:MAG: hypothetical protein BHW48_15245 [Roseburia sp. CAG:10041_57]|nr:MAG: hypothetical protein BHW48_15245 [Roseburia sp. CAG:10041_57]DAY92746.1 MAG TPA: protein of unknown function DUF1424 [Caudoviricetes sp.]